MWKMVISSVLRNASYVSRFIRKGKLAAAWPCIYGNRMGMGMECTYMGMDGEKMKIRDNMVILWISSLGKDKEGY